MIYTRKNKTEIASFPDGRRDPRNDKSGAGFTILELLLVVSLIGIVLVFSVVINYSFFINNDIDVATLTTVQSIRRAQNLSLGVYQDSAWGIKINGPQIILFKGSDYAARDISFDEVFDLPGSSVASGLSEIIFNKFSGIPQAVGSVILTAPNNLTRTVTINEQGVLSY